MKMSKELFEMMQADCMVVCKALGTSTKAINNVPDAWSVFHKVVFQRGMSDKHPHFKNGGVRFLPFDQEAEDDPRIKGNPYLGRFYELENLNDDHIRTALKRVFPNAF